MLYVNALIVHYVHYTSPTRVSVFLLLQKPLVLYKTGKRESPQEAEPARENSSLSFIEAVHQ